jgi:hypothetical protein
MNDNNFQEAEKLFDGAEPAPTVSEYEKEQLAIRANYERLKSARHAREAQSVTSVRVTPNPGIAVLH